MVQSKNLNSDEMLLHATEAAALLKAIANPSRLMILCQLIDGELSVGELNERIDLSQSALSQHLAALRKAALVETRKESQTVYYFLHGEKATTVIGALQSLFCPE